MAQPLGRIRRPEQRSRPVDLHRDPICGFEGGFLFLCHLCRVRSREMNAATGPGYLRPEAGQFAGLERDALAHADPRILGPVVHQQFCSRSDLMRNPLIQR